MTRSISGHLTETMQHHYSTVNGAEQREALGKVLRLVHPLTLATGGEDGGEGPSTGGRKSKRPAERLARTGLIPLRIERSGRRDSNPKKEGRESSRESARHTGNSAADAIDDDASKTTVPGQNGPARPLLNDADAALRLAIVAALDASDFDRVRALVAVLESSPRPASVLSLASHRPKR